MHSGTVRNADLMRAAERGDLEATHTLAMRLRLGLEGEPLPEVAAALLKLAARQGRAGSQLELGLMYAAGEGVPKDPHLAAMWVRRAAQQGIAKAPYWLARFCFHGEGVERNVEQAYRACIGARMRGFCDAGEILEAAAQQLGPERSQAIAAECGFDPDRAYDTAA